MTMDFVLAIMTLPLSQVHLQVAQVRNGSGGLPALCRSRDKAQHLTDGAWAEGNRRLPQTPKGPTAPPLEMKSVHCSEESC